MKFKHLFKKTKPVFDRERYKALYEYQKIQFDDKRNHYYKLEDKSSKYLTFLTIFTPIYVFTFTFIFKDLDFCKSIIIFSLAAFLVTFSLICFCSAWSYIFRSLKLMDIPEMPSDIKHIKMYDDYILESIYCHKADLYREAIEQYKISNDEKIRLINLAYKDIAFGSASFMISIVLLLIIKMASM